MEIENNIIQEKINGLNGLPAGYEPNIDSKWTVLEAALHGTKKNKLVLWRNVAATFLLVTGAAWMFFMIDQTPVKPKQYLQNDVKRSEKGIQPKEIAPMTSEETEKQEPQLRQIKKDISQQIVKEDLKVSHDTVYIDNMVNIPEESVVKINEKPKTKKARFVEIDFNDELTAGTKYAKPPEIDNSLKIKLGINSGTTTAKINDYTPVRFKKSF